MRGLARAAFAATAIAVLVAACSGPSNTATIAGARAALDKGDRAAAAVILKAVLQKQPESVEARLLFGRLLLDGGDGRTAEVELRKAQEMAATPDEVAPMLAKALLLNQKPKSAIEEFAGFKLDSANGQAELSAVLASAYLQLGQRDKAVASIEEATAAAPDNAAVSLVRARLLAGRGEVDEALRILDKPVHANDLDVQRFQADLQLLKGERAQALARYRKLLDRFPRDIYSHGQVIAIHLLERDLKSARAQLAILTKLHPSHPQVTYLTASVALRAGDFKQSRELATRLLAQLRENPRVLLLAGESELRLNALTQAEAHLSRLVALAPDSMVARRLLAVVHLRSGQPAKALDALKPGLAARSIDSETLSLAAEAHLLAGEPKAAEAFFQQLAKQQPDNVKARTALALGRLGRGDGQEAIAELESIAAKDAGALADLILIDTRMRRRDLDGALRAIDVLDQKQPDRALPAHLKGSVLVLLRQRSAARASFDTALKRDPLFVPSVRALADMDLLEQKPDAARKRYEALLKADPKHAQAMVDMAAMLLKHGNSTGEVAKLLQRAIDAKPGEASFRVMLVNHLLTLNDTRQALTAAQTALAAIPEEPSLLDALGRAQLANNDVVQSLATFGRIAANNPTSAFAQLRLADVHVKSGNLQAAEAALRKALEISPDLVVAQRGLIIIAMRNQQSERALQVARAVQKSLPQEAEGHLLEADIHAAGKKWDAAAAALREAQPKRNGAVAAVRLHTLMLATGRAKEAAKEAEDWLRRYPKDTTLRLHLGRVAMDGGDLASAERLYRQVIQLDPNDAAATNNVAWLMAKANRPGAVLMAEKAVSLAPHSASVLDTLAFALGQEDQIGKAIEVGKSAVQADPQLSQARLTLAKLYLKANDKQSAKMELESLARLGERFKSHQEVADLLKTL